MGNPTLLVLAIAISSYFSFINCSIQYRQVFERAIQRSSLSHQTDLVNLSLSFDVKSAADCARECARGNECVSFFYNSGIEKCVVLGVHDHFYPTSDVVERGWVYYRYPIDGSDCDGILRSNPASPDGVYTIDPPDGRGPLHVYCDMTTESGWTVFQRRVDGSVSFNRNWTAYKNGFGDLGGNFWLGNEQIHRLTSTRSMKLRIEMLDQEEAAGYAEYSTFLVEDESTYYRLKVEGFRGSRDNGMVCHNNMMFSTPDRDHDTFASGACAMVNGWWFCYCVDANLNGVYGSTVHGHGINWSKWHGNQYSLNWTEMKLKQA